MSTSYYNTSSSSSSSQCNTVQPAMTSSSMRDVGSLLLSGRGPADLKVAELKYWLSSRGKPVKGEKADLIAR